MAKSNDGPPSYFDVLSNELLVNIFHMLTGGPEWHLISLMVLNVGKGGVRQGGRRRRKWPYGI
jgi:hypothetical protein